VNLFNPPVTRAVRHLFAPATLKVAPSSSGRTPVWRFCERPPPFLVPFTHESCFLHSFPAGFLRFKSLPARSAGFLAFPFPGIYKKQFTENLFSFCLETSHFLIRHASDQEVPPYPVYKELLISSPPETPLEGAFLSLRSLPS